jgi:tripartite-type tricarboxylate transporter receptor subunit TctC
MAVAFKGLGLVCASVFMIGNAFAADDVANFYHGKTIVITTPFDNSGVYGQGASLVASFLSRYMPGAPSVVVQNMPGAAGLRQANYMYNTAPRDGTTVGILYDSTPEAQRLEPDQVHFDAGKFNALGSINNGDFGLVGVLRSSGVVTLDQARQKELYLGATGTASGQYVVPHIMNIVLKTKFKLIPGYAGIHEQFLAMEKGELQGMFTNYSTFALEHGDWVKEGRFAWLGQLAQERDKNFADVPLLQELAGDPLDKEAFQFLSLSRSIGKIFIAPPGVPSDRLSALRSALESVLKNDEVHQALVQMHVEYNPRAWQPSQKVLLETAEMPENVIARVRDLSNATN